MKKKLILILSLISIVVAIGGALWLVAVIPPKSYSPEEIYQMAAPSVVEINGTSYKGDRKGVGFFYDEEGTVITSYSVIKDCAEATIKTYDGKEYEVVSIKGFDIAKDIVVLGTSCDSSKPFPYRKKGLKLKEGEPVYVIGSSFDASDNLFEGVIEKTTIRLNKQLYIQTTTATSSQNMGAPVVDQYGHIIGISTISFVDGKKVSLALPAAQLEMVRKTTPTLLSEMFKPVVQTVTDTDVIYDAASDEFIVYFGFGDKDYIPISTSGTVNITIKNDDGRIVYNGYRQYDETDYEICTVRGSAEKYLAAIHIPSKDIDKGLTPYGTITVSLTAGIYDFGSLQFSTYELPYKK